MQRICKYCGKEFEAKGTQVYCAGLHYDTYEICGTEMVINIRKLVLKIQIVICIWRT